MGKSDEVFPTESQLIQLIDHGIRPLIQKIEDDLKESLPTTLTLCKQELLGLRILIAVTQENPLPEPRGEVRLRVRSTFKEGRFLYFAESIYKNVAPKTGFSGFMLNGEMLEGNPITVRQTGSVMRYNVWEWAGWK